MAARRYRLEVWDRTGSTRRAIFGAVLRAERRQVLQAEVVLTAEVAAQDAAADALTTGAVLRLQREGSPTDFTLWRLASRAQERAPDDGLRLRITADALWMDLRLGAVRQRLVDGRSQYVFGLEGLTPQEWLEHVILPGYEGDATGFQVGVVELSDAVDLSFDRVTTPLAALRMLEGALQGATGGLGEVQFRLDPTGQFYWIDILERVGAAQGTAELRYGKNIRGLERLEDEADVETRIRATGAGLLTLADAEWRIASVSGPSIARVLTFEGPHPVHETGACVGLWFRVPPKGLYPIIGSSASTGTLTVDASGRPALGVGDIGHIVTDTEGTRLDYLESPAGREAYGVRPGVLVAEDVPDADNRVPNPDLSEWSDGLPAGWTKLGGPTVLETTDRRYAQRGGAAARIVAATDGEGLLSPAFTLGSTAERPYTALLAGLTLISGQARVELRHEDGTVYPIRQRPVLVEREVYTELKAGPVHDEPLPEGTYRVAVVAHGEASEFVLDCAMVTPVIGEEVPAYVTGSGAHRLWERAAAELEDRRRPRLEYRVDIVDLHAVDPGRFRFDRLNLGDDVKLRDPDFPRESVRIVELVEDVLDATATQVVLAPSARRRVVDPFRPPPSALGGSLSGPGRRPPSSTIPEALQVMRQWDASTQRLAIGALGSPVVATLELRTRTSTSDPWPSAPVATISGRQGWFPPQPVAAGSTLYYQVTPKDGRGVAGDPVEDSWTVLTGPQGPPGADGTYVDYRFRASAERPDTPTGTDPSGWSDAPVEVPAGQLLWMTSARRDARTGALLGPWSEPVWMAGVGSANLFGLWAQRYQTTAGEVIGQDRISDMRLEPGDVVSISARIRRASGSGLPRIYIEFRSGSSTIQSVDVTSTTSEWARIGAEGLVIPAGTDTIRVRVPPPTGGGTVTVGEWMCNRGPVMLPYEDPAWRPARGEPIPSGATVDDGAGPKLIPKGARSVTLANGETATFADSYQNPPLVIPGPGATMEQRDRWGTIHEADADGGKGLGNDPAPMNALIKQAFGADVSTTQITARLRLVATSDPVAKSASFAAPTSAGVGDVTGNATPADADVPAVGDRFKAKFTVFANNAGDAGPIRWTVALEVALDNGTFAEVGAKSVIYDVDPAETAVTVDDEIEATVSGVDGGNDRFRLRLKSALGPPGVTNFSLSVAPGALTWSSDANALYASATPNGDQDAVTFFIIAQG